MTLVTSANPNADAHGPEAGDEALIDPAALPTFIGIGAQRAGTTWLHSCLSEHPEVYLPEEKELDFFGSRDGRGLGWYGERFEAGRGYAARGEITPTYMVDERAIAAMHRVAPGAKLFAVLREPVGRAYSAYQLAWEKRYRDRSFAEACTETSDLVRYGRYAEQLETVWRYFPRSRVKVFIYEELSADPAGLLRELCAFLGVDEGFEPASLTRRYNRIMFAAAQRRLRAAGLGWAIEAVKRTPVGDWVRAAHRRAGRKAGDVLSASERRRVAGYFRDDIDRLEALLGRDLSAWR